MAFKPKEIKKNVYDYRGNIYKAVQYRINQFRGQLKDNPPVKPEHVNWKIINEAHISEISGGMQCHAICKIYDEKNDLQAQAHAFQNREKHGDNYINWHNFVENAETSAIGRALKLLGYAYEGGSGSGPSSEEVLGSLMEELIELNLIDENGSPKKELHKLLHYYWKNPNQFKETAIPKQTYKTEPKQELPKKFYEIMNYVKEQNPTAHALFMERFNNELVSGEQQKLSAWIIQKYLINKSMKEAYEHMCKKITEFAPQVSENEENKDSDDIVI